MHKRIAVPGDHIEFFCQNTVIDVVEPLHEIGRDRDIFLLRALPDGADLGSRIVREVPCGESPPVQLMSHNGDLPVGIRRFYLFKSTVPRAPECGPPFVIKFLYIPVVALPEEVLKLRFTQVAEAFAAEFIGDMPCQKSRMIADFFCQFSVNDAYLLTIDFGRHAVVVAKAMSSSDTHVIDAHDLRILTVQPRRARGRRRCQDRIDPVFIEMVHDLMKPLQMELAFFRLIHGPGKHTEGRFVDSGLLHVLDVFFQDIGPVQPLIRIIISTMNDFPDWLSKSIFRHIRALHYMYPRVR